MNRDEPRWTEMNRDSNLDSSRFISVHLGSSSVHLDWFRHMSVRKHESGTFLYENTISAHFGTKTQNVHIYTNPREHVYRCPPQFVLIVWSILINHIYIYIYVMLNSEFLSNIFQECYLGAIYSHIYIYIYIFVPYCLLLLLPVFLLRYVGVLFPTSTSLRVPSCVATMPARQQCPSRVVSHINIDEV